MQSKEYKELLKKYEKTEEFFEILDALIKLTDKNLTSIAIFVLISTLGSTILFFGGYPILSLTLLIYVFVYWGGTTFFFFKTMRKLNKKITK